MKYKIITFGCQMNKSDSERIATVLEKTGYKPVKADSSAEALAKADLILVNMCSVRQSAVDRVFGLIPKFQKLKTKNYKLTLRQAQGDGERSRTIKTILTGCVLKKDRKKFAKNFDLILDIKNLPNWPNLSVPNSHDRALYEPGGYLSIQPKYQDNFRVFIPISNGCNNFCAFCVVPYVRGHLVCRDSKEILEEAKLAVKNGVKEIWLLGQNVNDYRNGSSLISTRNNAEVNFAKLLKMVNEIPGNFWIRFTSPHPAGFSNELIETMTKCQKVTPYLNLPVQSGNNEILKKMNRPYTVEQYKNLVKKIRNKIPNIALSTDIIVGFPGETKRQFENTVKLFKEIKFDMAYISKYSPRPGTTAAKFKDDVPCQEKERRYKILTEILKKTALEKNKKYVGKTIEVLIMEHKTYNLEHFYFGKTRTYKTVKIPNSQFLTLNSNLIGQFVEVKIKKALPCGLECQI